MTDALYSPLIPAEISVEDTPFRVLNLAYEDIYFSTDDAVEESLHHYIYANKLENRFKRSKKSFFTVAELGFGTGLNAFLTIDAFKQRKSDKLKKLYYIATELHPIRPDDLQAIHTHLASKTASHNGVQLDFNAFSKKILAHYPEPFSGVHTIQMDHDVDIILLWGDSLCRLKQYQMKADAWFFDGFAPNKNPTQWTLSLCREVARLSHDNTSLSAFSCARNVKDALNQAGFELEKVKGFGRKREILTAHFSEKPNVSVDLSDHPQWAAASPEILDDTETNSKQITIIGAGLAGAFTAKALAELGVKVEVLTDKANFNTVLPCAALHLHLSTAKNIKHDIDLTAYAIAVQAYQTIYEAFSVGLLEFDEHKRQAQLIAQASHRAALSVDGQTGATLYHEAGAIQPNEVIRYCLANPLINVCFNQSVTEIDIENKQIKVQASNKSNWQNYEQLIVCTGAHSVQLLPLLQHTSKPIRGQLSRFKTTVEINPTILCHHTLQVPFSAIHDQLNTGETPESNVYYAGGTYDLHDPRAVIKDQDNEQNLQSVCAHDIAHKDDKLIDAWAGLRLSSNDTLPFISPYPNVARYITDYAHLKHHATRPVSTPASYIDGLFVNSAYGSKGSLYAPIAAKIIAHYIYGTPAPLPSKAMSSVHLGRFVVRHIRRRTVDTLL